MRRSEEYICCSAIWYKDLPKQTFLPINIDSGLVVSGLRHAHCIDIVKSLSGLRTVQIAPDGVGETVQGFITSKNWFVDRHEALRIAIKAKQVDENNLRNSKIGLFSEDLY